MKAYFSKPNYTDVSGPNWTVVAAADGTSALSDLTTLGVATVAEKSYGGYVTAAHASPLTPMFIGYSTLTSQSRGTRWTVNELSANYRDVGDTFIYVDDVTGFAQGQVAAILEDNPNNQTSRDGFYSEYLTIGGVGLIPATPVAPHTDATCLYFPAEAGEWYAPLTAAGNFDQLDPSGAVTPAGVNQTPTLNNAFYISASADPVARYNLLELLPDWVGGLEITAISAGSGSSTFTMAGLGLGLKKGMTLTVVSTYNGVGYWAGDIVQVVEGVSTTTVTTSLTTSAQASNSIGWPTNVAGYVLPSDAVAGRYCAGYAATITDPKGIASTVTINNASNQLEGSYFTTPYFAQTAYTDQCYITKVEQVTTSKVRYHYPTVGATGAPGHDPAASVVGQWPIVTVAGTGVAQFDVIGSEIANQGTDVDGSYFEIISSATVDAPISPANASATFFLPGSADNNGSLIDGSHYGGNLFFPVNITNIIGPPVATFQSMSDATSIGGYSEARVITVDDASKISVGDTLTFRSEYYNTNGSATVSTTGTTNTLNFSGSVVANQYGIKLSLIHI